MDTRKILFVVAGGLLVVVAVYYGWKLLAPKPKKATPQQLAETALDKAAPPERRVEAAAELAQFRPTERESTAASQEMSRVYQASPDPAVKAIVITGMVSNLKPESFDSMETFFAAMDDGDLGVRVRAHGAVKRLLQADAGYKPEAPREERLAKIAKYRAEWERLQTSPDYKAFREKLKQELEAAGGTQ